MIRRMGFLRNFDVVSMNLNLCCPTWRVLLARMMFPNISMVMHLADFLRLS